MRRDRDSAKKRRLILAGLSLVAAFLLGWILGGAGGSSEQDPAAANEGPASRELRSGVLVDFAHSREGAAAAAAAFQQAFASPAILKPGVLRERIEAVATPGYVQEMLSANDEGVARLASGPLGVGVRSHLQTIYSGVPIGYAVQSYREDRARILTWGFTLLGNAESVEPSAYFGTSVTELSWTSDGWRVAETRAGSGPTPQLATAPPPGEGFEVLRLAKELRGYELAP